MDELNIKSEFTPEMEESYLDYNINTPLPTPSEGGSLSYDMTAGSEETEYDNSQHFHELQSQAEMKMQFNQPDDQTTNAAHFDRPSAPPTRNVIDGANVRFEFTAGYRRNSVLLYLIDHKQLFTKKYSHNHMDRYTCYNKICRASLLFDSQLNKIVKLYNPSHIHPDQADVYKKMKVLNEMKDYCLTNDSASLTTKQIFDQKCNVMKDAAHLVEYQKIKRNLARLKKSTSQNPTGVAIVTRESNSLENTMYGIFPSDIVTASNDFASKWDSKPLRDQSPIPSDPESQNADSVSSNIDKNAPSTSRQNESFEQNQPFKKIKLSHHPSDEKFEEPFTEGYLEDFQQKITKANLRRPSPTPPPPASVVPSRPKKASVPPRQDEGNHVCSSCPCILAQESQYDKIGKVWASELKQMTFDQQIFAKRAIAEILFEGQLGGLSRDSVMIRRQGDPFVVEESEFMFDKSESNVAAVS